jgi:hypothetical protein
MPLPLTSFLLLPLMPLLGLFADLSNYMGGYTDSFDLGQWITMFKEWPGLMPKAFQTLRDIGAFSEMIKVLSEFFSGVFASLF